METDVKQLQGYWGEASGFQALTSLIKQVCTISVELHHFWEIKQQVRKLDMLS